MPKPAKMKSRIKANDRRRRRRVRQPATSGEPKQNVREDSPTDPPQGDTDIAGLLSIAALRAADRHREVQDSSILSALRALITDAVPTKAGAQLVYSAMVQELDAAEVSHRQRTIAAKEFLELAKHHSGSDRPDVLLQYLSLILA